MAMKQKHDLALVDILLCYTAVLLLMLSATPIRANDNSKLIAIGLSAGIVRPINEAAYANNQDVNSTVNIFAMIRDAFAPGFTPELHFSRTTNASKDTLFFSAYRTNLWTADLRLRWTPWTDLGAVVPYASLGLGIVLPENEFPRVVQDPTFRRNTSALLAPVHLGALIRLTNELSADIHAGWMITSSDDINPTHDGRSDGWLRACAGVVYTIPASAVDFDGDELPDTQERAVGTDPNRPDTDADGLSDGDEVQVYQTNPLNVDTDDGGVMDGIEVQRGTNPTLVSDDILSILPGETVSLRNIIFETGQTTFPSSSVSILESLKIMLEKNPLAEIMINGHTDAIGDRDSNFTRSGLRAQGVRNWLMTKGIAASRMVTSGLGPDKPASSNSSAEGRRRNRRIDIMRIK